MEDKKGSISIPRWAQWIGGAIGVALVSFISAAISWCMGVSSDLSEIKAQIAGQVRVTEIQIQTLEKGQDRINQTILQIDERVRHLESENRSPN